MGKSTSIVADNDVVVKSIAVDSGIIIYELSDLQKTDFGN